MSILKKYNRENYIMTLYYKLTNISKSYILILMNTILP